jgi:glucarate dehydratase
MLDRRQWLGLSAAGLCLGHNARLVEGAAAASGATHGPLVIKGLKVTPIALPDPPILAAGGCHGPYFLRNVVQLETDAGIVGIGETKGGENVTQDLQRARKLILGANAFAYRSFAGKLIDLSPACYAAVELACLDACGKATGRRLCELLGGPVSEEVEFAAYLFYRYAADHPKLLADPRMVDGRGRGDKALDAWGEVRTPEAMAELAVKFRDRFGFRVFKLKAGVLKPEEEVQTLKLMHARLGNDCPLRIDPNARWTMKTALAMAEVLRGLPLEYYEDPVAGQEDMGEVRRKTKLPMSTNMCVTRFAHIPPAVKTEPIDVLLCDHHNFGGIIGCQALGPICQALDWRMSQHSNNHAGITMAAMIHVAAVTPQLTLASDTHYPWLVAGADIIEGPNLTIRRGHMQVPTRPGVGVSLDVDKLARAHETYTKCGMRERDDARTMQLVEPGWRRTLL